MKTEIIYNKHEFEEKTLVIEDLYVIESERRKGIGKKLVKDAIRYAIENDFEKILLYASPTDDSISERCLIDFYKNLGFESDGDCDEIMEYIL